MSVSIERELIFKRDTPALQVQGEKLSPAETVEIYKTDCVATPVEIHVTEHQGFKRLRGVTFYLTPEMVKAIVDAQVPPPGSLAEAVKKARGGEAPPTPKQGFA